MQDSSEGNKMKKRFTDTDKWSDKWFRPLSATAKLLWIWLCDNCDNAGVVDPDMELLTFQIGQPVKPDHFAELGDRLQKLANGKWWIPKFVRFQFGELSTGSLVHKSVISLLKSHTCLPKDNQLLLHVNGLAMGCERDMGLLSPKEKEKEKEKEKGRGSRGRGIPPTVDEIRAYAPQINFPVCEIEKFYHYYESNGWRVGKNPMKSWTAAMVNWREHWRERRFTPEGKPAAGAADKILKKQSLDRIEARIDQIRRNAPVEGWKKTDKGLEELQRLKREREKLKDELGLIV